MRRKLVPLAATLALAPALLAPSLLAEGHWPSFRGPSASGVSEGAPTPTTWNVETGENVLWKTAIPGLGLSSPVIWGDRLFVTTAVAEAGGADLKVGQYGDIAAANDNGIQDWKIYCLDRHTGEILWQQTAKKGKPLTARHTKASHASATAATDGEVVAAHFGSEGLYVWDMDGTLLWKKDFGKLASSFFQVPQAEWGYASSPTLHDGTLLVLHDVIGDSALIALDAKTGDVRWQASRTDVPSWGTPTVVETEGRTQVVINGFNEIAGYDFATGEELWKMGGGGDIPVPTPVFAHGMIYLASAHGPASPLFAVRPDAVGEIDSKDSGGVVVWQQERVGVYLQTPLVYGDEVYAGRGNGGLLVYDAKTGEERYKARIDRGMGFTASPVAADGKVYFTSESGDVHVIEAGPGPELKTLAVNPLDELAMATPAIAEGTLYFRGRRHLFAVSEAAKPAAKPAPAPAAKPAEGAKDESADGR
ncbi:MAG: PQQ-binding-like beta-propeller repeat protein [Acidobacteriota bacterium]